VFPSNRDAVTEWIATHPTNFYALRLRAERLIEEKEFQEAKAPLRKLVELYPSQAGGDSAYATLAVVHRALNETNEERQVLTQLAEQDNEATDAYSRLMELGAAAQDWPAVTQNAQRYLAVNPLMPSPYRFLAQASERRGEPQPAIAAYRALLQLDPPDPAETHFRLAQLLDRTGDSGARRHVLQALEEAPRYRAALQLLLEINKKPPQTKADAAPTAR
jgi:tetratricopeptide (TPR) repeat protein